MNGKDKGRIRLLGHYICGRLKQIQDESKDPWHKLNERQAFQDVLQGMVHYGLIDDYDIEHKSVILRGEK